MYGHYNCGCPVCGYLNKDVNLLETNGEMECEACQLLITVEKPFMNFIFTEEERDELHRIATSKENPSGRILHITVAPSASLRKKQPEKLAV